MIEEDPYVLCKLEIVGFLTADRIAIERLHIAKDSPHRKAAGIFHILHQNETSGSVWMEIGILDRAVQTLLACEASDAIEKVIIEKQVVFRDNMVANIKASEDEAYIAMKIRSMLTFEGL